MRENIRMSSVVAMEMVISSAVRTQRLDYTQVMKHQCGGACQDGA